MIYDSYIKDVAHIFSLVVGGTAVGFVFSESYVHSAIAIVCIMYAIVTMAVLEYTESHEGVSQ